MSWLHRRYAVIRRRETGQAVPIPSARELRAMSADQVRALAERLGLDYTTKAEAIQAIRARA